MRIYSIKSIEILCYQPIEILDINQLSAEICMSSF